MAFKSNVVGTIYKNGSRYWWKVKFPGQAEIEQIPLKQPGAKFATKDQKTAEVLAWQLWQEKLRLKVACDRYDGKLITLATRYYDYCVDYYQPPSTEAYNRSLAIFPFANHYKDMMADDVTSVHVKWWIKHLLSHNNWVRTTYNRRLIVIKAMFKWAASEMLVSMLTYQNIETVENLKKGRSTAREPRKIRPASEKDIKAVIPYLPATIISMVKLQMITGMRSTEICIMRPCDIDRSDEVWVYKPTKFKNQWREDFEEKEIYLGPLAQKIVSPYLFRKPEMFLFSPAESMQQVRQKRHSLRVTPLSCGNRPKTCLSQKFNPRYNKDSYRIAIKRACKCAFLPPENIKSDKNKLKKWKKEHTWHPHQLRHLATTNATKRLNGEMAKAYIRHSDKKMTKHYSTEAEKALAIEAALKIG